MTASTFITCNTRLKKIFDQRTNEIFQLNDKTFWLRIFVILFKIYYRTTRKY